MGSAPKNIHLVIKSSNIGFAYQGHNLSGQHVSNGPVCSGDYDYAGHSNLPPLTSGFCDKPEEVGLGSGAKRGVSWASGGLRKYDIEIDRGKSSKSFKLLQNNFSQSGDIHFRTDKIIRPNLFYNTGSNSSSSYNS